jgi:hypothetical protein
VKGLLLNVSSRVRVVLGGGALVVAGGALVWRGVDWTSQVELHIVKEALPPHAPISAIWLSDDATRALAVGAGGDVLERLSELGEGMNGHWQKMDSAGQVNLHAVAGGEGPWRGDTFFVRHHVRVLAAGAHGALIDCSGGACRPIASGTDRDLRAVAVAGGQALVVGDGGTILHVKPDPSPPVAGLPDDAIKVEGQDVPGVSADLRAVLLECDDQDHGQRCLAIVVGDGGTIVEGTEEGYCDNGERVSGVTGRHCDWRWTRVRSSATQPIVAVWRSAGGIFAGTHDGGRLRRGDDGSWVIAEAVAGTWNEVLAPVHLVERKFWLRREETIATPVAFGEKTRGLVRASWVAIPSAETFVAGATPRAERGEMVLLASHDGAVYLAR